MAKAPSKGSKITRTKPADVYAEADKVLQKGLSAKNADEAAKILEDLIDELPEDVEAHWRIAKGYITVLEKETGTVLVERAEYYPLLDSLGKKALSWAEKAYALAPKSADASGWYMVAFGYHSVAIGIVRAFLGGAPRKYLGLCDETVKLDPKWHSAAAYRAMGRFYREAPWPKRDIPRAIDCFKKAVEIAPKRQENKLHLGLAYMDNRQKAEAKDLLSQVVKGKPEPSEKHFNDSLVVFAKGKLSEL